MKLICLLLPAVFSIYVYELISGKKLNIKEFIVYYSIFNVIINLTIWIIAYYLFKNIHLIFSVSFCIKYVSLAIILSFIYSIIVIAFEKNVRIKLYVKKS